MKGHQCDACGAFGSNPKYMGLIPDGWVKFEDSRDREEHFCGDCMEALKEKVKPDTSNPNPAPRGPWYGLGIFR